VEDLIQWKPLNVITLGLKETENINKTITKTEFSCTKHCNVEIMGPRQVVDNIDHDHIMQLSLYIKPK
jgi:hypothetical protein